MKRKIHIMGCVALLLCGFSAQASLHHYELGEAGSYDGSGLALDSVGSADFSWGTALSVTAGGTAAPGSTHYSTLIGGGNEQGGASLSGLAASDIEISLWVRTADTAQYATFFSTDSSTDDGLNFLIVNDNWFLYGGGGVWIDSGVAAVANQWTHLEAKVNGSGQTLFYVDGNYQDWGATTLVHGATKLGYGAKGGSFAGDIDDIQIIPEPSVAALLGVFGGGLIFLRRHIKI